MNSKITNILDFLHGISAESKFKEFSLPETCLPSGIKWFGGIESKSLNIHRAVCFISCPAAQENLESSICELKTQLHKNLKARFWRGLGVGIILYSDDLFENETLNRSVYSAQKVSTTIIQWIVNIDRNFNKAKICHTFTEVSTSFIINEFLDNLDIKDEEREIVLTEQTNPLKTKLF